MSDMETTPDPATRLLVDGREVAARRVNGDTHIFDIPAGAVDVFIVSRRVVPAEHEPGRSDRRRLGVSILSLVLRNDRVEIRVRADDPELWEGFHEAEPGHRWTDGMARLPLSLLAPFTEAFELELRLNPTALCYPLR
jgi:hypothetical protein